MDKYDLIRSLGVFVEKRKGWHVDASWKAKRNMSNENFLLFMKQMGWESNLHGMLRFS